MLTDTISLFRKIKFEREQLKQLMYAWTSIIILYEKQQAKCILNMPNSKKTWAFCVEFSLVRGQNDIYSTVRAEVGVKTCEICNSDMKNP